MKAVFVGTETLAVMAAHEMLRRGHEVVMIERNKERIDGLAEELGCGFLHGDGTRPAVLREASPGDEDFLFCLTESDQTNIIASLVGRSIGFTNVVTRIQDPSFEHICLELGLNDTIIPAQTIGRYLADMLEGSDLLELSAMIKAEARVFSFVVGTEDAVPISDLQLPADTRVMCLYRDEHFVLPADDTTLHKGDEVVLITHSQQLQALHERWSKTGRSSRRPRI